MTEDEAKTKWCPFARVMVEHSDGNHYGPMNRSVTAKGDVRNSMCIGSGCMMWHQLNNTSHGWCGMNGARTAEYYGCD